MIFEISACESVLGYKFNDPELLRQCFTHPSYANENAGVKDNERLEFFGDAIIEFVVTEYLYKKYKKEEEGDLTVRRQTIVSKDPLNELVFYTGLDRFIILGNGMAPNRNDKLFSSVYEAVVAGIYLDGGIKSAEKFIYSTLLSDKFLSHLESDVGVKTASLPEASIKNVLQEFVQKYKLGEIKYVSVSRFGPDNSPVFTEAVTLNGTVLATGNGTSKKKAQVEAATVAYERLKKERNKRIYDIEF
ncbi:MAG: ribonuclease III [Clostridia bacterium]|nr:ribonuclease III [Clostridia bacterium]